MIAAKAIFLGIPLVTLASVFVRIDDLDEAYLNCEDLVTLPQLIFFDEMYIVIIPAKIVGTA